jgi:hypothetical protein
MKNLVARLMAGYHEQNDLIANLLARVWTLEQQVDDIEARENYRLQAAEKAAEFVEGTRTRHQEMLSLLSRIPD